MRITVQYTTQIKTALGAASEEIELPDGATLPELIMQLVARRGDPLESLLLDDRGRPLPSIIFCVGDQQIDYHSPVPLAEGDEVTLLSAISGG